jgi:hypothetical protein
MARKKVMDLQASASFDQKFWIDFSKNFWEKKHLHVQNFQSTLQKMDESEVFRLLVLYSNQCRKNKDPRGFKFFIHGMQTNESDILQILPVLKDKNFLGYHQRMQKMFPDYCLVCDELLSVDSKHRSVLTDFTDELYKNVGFPNRFSEMGLYLGNYQKTPFGVHVDHCGVFSFPVVGEKKFRLWTAEFVKKNPALDRSFKYEKYKKNSQVLTAHPGDMTYWPSTAWHIAESDGAFSATWSLGVWVDLNHGQVFSEGLTQLLNDRRTFSDQFTTTTFKTLYKPSGEVNELPMAFLESIQNLKKMTTEEFTESFFLLWMKHISLKGFKTSPKSLQVIQKNSRLGLQNPNEPVLWYLSPCVKYTIYFCFGGVIIESQTQSGISSLLLKLNQGQICRVKDFLKGVSFKIELMQLNELAKAGAFT